MSSWRRSPHSTRCEGGEASDLLLANSASLVARLAVTCLRVGVGISCLLELARLCAKRSGGRLPVSWQASILDYGAA